MFCFNFLYFFHSFITENPFSVPGAPGKPMLKDWDSDHFDMKWEAPKNDGGSRITGYDLEARPWKDLGWFKAGEVKMAMEHGVVEGGIELGHGYAVRVRARNAAGPGHWSIESDQVVCRYKSLAPKVKLNCPKELALKETDTLIVEADVPAEPPCEDIRWFIGERELVDNVKNGITIDNRKMHKSILQIDCLSRKDQGHLSCEGSNMNGSAKAKINLIVYSKPGPPEDRLVVSDISANGCKLTWEPTKHTGGLPVDYLVEKYIVSADAWAKQGVTGSTFLKVNDLDVGKEYEFRVFAVNEIGESEALKTNKAMLAKEKYTVSLPPGQPTVTEWNERSMTLVWDDPIDDGGTAITGYVIEAKRPGVGNWQIWETLDCKDNKVVLQKLTKGHEYQFRVIAVNKAGRSEASHASRPKVAKETDLMPFIDAKNMTDVTAEAKERVKFDVGIHGEPAPEITWYKVEGDNKVPVESLNDKSIQMMQTDTHAKLIFNSITAAHAGTYTIVARNKSGEDAATGRIKVLDR